ncbi:SO2930 family diheme c-type cytochrome [Shewanella jiangmenensis]|nr:SO2930 family diheme c-type cytochrome [Shewanella jiangmenensis]
MAPALILAQIVALVLALILQGCGGGDGKTSSPTSPPTTPPTTPPVSGSVCDATHGAINQTALMSENCPKLSDYRLFADPANPNAAPNGRGIAYELASELFTDYAIKRRFVFLPEGATAQFTNGKIEYPTGTALVKSFSLPADTSETDPGSAKLIETRLLIRRDSGWTALVYLWQGSEAVLKETGADVLHSMNRAAERLDFSYHVPSRAECKLCHQTQQDSVAVIAPIGPKPLLLNKDIPTPAGVQNQLLYWQSKGLLTGLGDVAALPKTWGITEQSKDLTARAKGYLDANCAHCHNPTGFASVSGLRLGFEVDSQSYQYGICKQPPGWDGGARGLSYDIVPGNSDHSILVYRQTLDAPKDRMPPLGRNLVHTEAVTEISRWIDLMAPSIGNCQ